MYKNIKYYSYNDILEFSFIEKIIFINKTEEIPAF